MSTLVTQTISNGTVSTSSANVIQGSARAWVSFGGGQNSTAGSIFGTAFNVSSITVNGTGDYTVNYTNAIPNTNYIVMGGCQEDNNNAGATTNRVCAPKRTPLLTTSVRVGTVDFGYAAQNVYQVYVAVFSS